MNECPVCGYNQLEFPPTAFTICACCGTEFGYDDRMMTHAELTEKWIRNGFPWFDVEEPQPQGWNPLLQLANAKKNSLRWAIPEATPVILTLKLQAVAA